MSAGANGASASAGDGDRGGALGAFLRARRERIAPARVGLAGGGRRRTPGLRRAEVAARAGVATDYYARVEQGRGGAPTPAVLDALARALLLSEPERLHLHRLAQRAGPPGAPVAAVAPQTHALLDALAGQPALVLDPRADPLAWNAAAEELFGGLARRPAGERNLLWLLFGGDPEPPPPAAPRVMPLPGDELTPALVAGLRARRAGPADDPAIAAVAARVARTSPLFEKLLGRASGRGGAPRPRPPAPPHSRSADGELDLARAARVRSATADASHQFD